jgi:hypothetical protein
MASCVALFFLLKTKTLTLFNHSILSFPQLVHHQSIQEGKRITRGRYCYVGVNLPRVEAVTTGAAKGGIEGGGSNLGKK